MIVKSVAIVFAEVARFADAQDRSFEEVVEAPHHLLWRGFPEVPWPDRVFDGLEQGVLADALRSAKDKCVVDLLVGVLHAVRQPWDDMIGVVRVDFVYMVEPWTCLVWVTWLDVGRYIEVEAGDTVALDPATLGDQPVLDVHRLAWRPRDLFDRAMSIQPLAGGNHFLISLWHRAPGCRRHLSRE